jgi:hypothetical protein
MVKTLISSNQPLQREEKTNLLGNRAASQDFDESIASKK